MKSLKAIGNVILAAAAFLACDGNPVEHDNDAHLTLSPDTVVVGINQSSPLIVMVRAASGAIQYEVGLQYVSRDQSVATVNASGTITGRAAGSTYVVVMLSERPDVRDSVRVRVPAPPGPLVPSGPFVAGQSYFGRDNYIEYVAGNSPVLLTAPHGGALHPSDIATRNCGINGADQNTQELVRAIQTQYFRLTGKYPHIVINRLHRSKLDANRDLAEATCGDARAGVAWTEWHAMIGIARTAALQDGGGKAWYMDVHGHTHAIPRLELGYLRTSLQLNLSDAQLDATTAYEEISSIRSISAANTDLSFSQLLRGPNSLGALYAKNGIRSIPSDSVADRAPGTEPYYSVGYNTLRYTCSDGGGMCGVQLETHFAGVRDNAANRERFGEITVNILRTYLDLHWGLKL
jgi:hypothetical protein